MKVIAICGSMKFSDEMIKIAEQMTLDDNIVLLPIFFANNTLTRDELFMLGKMHKKKIEMSNSVLIVDIGEYYRRQYKI